MTEPSRSHTALADIDLIAAVRSGELEAYGDLFARHREAAHRLALQLTRSSSDADELVAESFSRVLTALQNGNGPDEFFRAYLLTSLRRLHIDQSRAAQRVRTTDDEAELDRAVAFVDPAEMKFEQSVAAAAFASLPERWQLVLWHLDVEGQKPAQIAPLLGMSSNSVSALAYRAREGLRTAYLQAHLAPPLDDECQRTTPKLAQHVRRALSAREATAVDEHLDTCARCSGLYAELAEVNQHLAGVIAPVVLGTAAAGYLASSGSVAGAGLFAHIGSTIRRPLRSMSTAGPAGVAVAAVAAVVIATSAYAAVQATGGDAPAPTSAAGSATSQDAIASPDEPDARGQTPGRLPSEVGATTAAPVPTAPTAPPSPTSLVPPLATPTPAPSATKTPRPEPTKPTRPAPTRGPVPVPTMPSLPQPTLTIPTVEPPRPTGTDLSAGVTFVKDPSEQLRRAITIAVQADEALKPDTTVTVTMTFNALDTNGVQFRGAAVEGWQCTNVADGEPLVEMSCTRQQTGPVIPQIAFALHGYYPGVSVLVTANDNVDPNPAPATARACGWSDPNDCHPY